MLRILEDILDFIEDLNGPIAAIRRYDPNLAEQLSKASASVGLNAAEGSAATGRQKLACYRVALREMRESNVAIAVAERRRYLGKPSAASADRASKITGTLVRLAYPKAR